LLFPDPSFGVAAIVALRSIPTARPPGPTLAAKTRTSSPMSHPIISHILACAKLHQVKSLPFYLLEKLRGADGVKILNEIAGIGGTVH
jgi:hypothetical protein